MLIKTILSLFLFTFSFSSYAFFFDNVKCGDNVAIEALRKGIYEDASSALHEYYIKERSDFYNKDFNLFRDALQAIEVSISNVTTLENKNNNLSCQAMITVTVPEDVMVFIKERPELATFMLESNGILVSSRAVAWKNSKYVLSVADNKKDVMLDTLHANTTVAPEVMHIATMLSVTMDDMKRAEGNQRLDKAERQYSIIDSRLNSVWNDLSDAIRKSMKNEQVAWVKSKTTTCGNLSDTKLDTVEPDIKIGIYECQTNMTQKRIDYLIGNK